MIRIAIVLLVTAILAPEAQAQDGEYGRIEATQAAAPGYFYLARKGEPVISVTALGAVGQSGQYQLGQGITLGEFLAVTGGVATDRMGKATVRLHQSGASIREIELRSLYTENAVPIVLRDGDFVEVVGLTSTVPGFFVHTQPGSEPFAVTASGGFSAPGRYNLDPGSTVSDLVAYAGGLGTLGTRDSNTSITATVRLYRSGEILLEAPLNDLYSRQPMTLQSGDAVDLEVIVNRRGSFWRDALSVATAVLSAAVLVDRLTN